MSQLEQAHSAGYLDDSEFQELKSELLNAFVKSNEAISTLPTAVKEESQQEIQKLLASSDEDDDEEEEAEEGSLPQVYLEKVVPGLELGPEQHRFRIVLKLGDEQAGRVWLAEALTHGTESAGRYKALKLFAPRLQDEIQAKPARGVRFDPANLRSSLIRIRVKTTLLTLFDHPNIGKVYGWRQGKDGWPFVEMEYLQGCSLQHLLQQEGKLTWTRTLDLLRPIATTLDYVHREHQLAHRNLKATNVFITDHGVVKLLDFGLTLQPRDAQAAEEVAAIPAQNAAPESRGDNGLSFKRDIGALAALTYHMLSGNPPYPEDPTVGLDPLTFPAPSNDRRGNGHKLAALPTKPENLSDLTWKVLQQGLAYQTDTYPASAKEWITQLAASQAPSGNWLGFKPRQWIAVLLAVGLIGGTSVFVWQGRSPPRALDTGHAQVADKGSSPPAGQATASAPPAPAAESAPIAPSQGAEAAGAREMDDRAYAAAQRLNSVEAYRIYLQRCPDCAHRVEAETALQTHQRQARIAELESRFETHLEKKDLAAGGQSGQNALAVLAELATLNPSHPLLATGKKRVALAYADLARESFSKHNYAEARHWLRQGEAVNPGLPALAALATEVDNAEAKGVDDAAFARAKQIDTRNAYHAYLAACVPICGHKQEVEVAIEKLKSEPPSVKNPLFRDALKGGGQGPEMVVITAGEYVMGSPAGEAGRFGDEGQQRVVITHPFALGRFEVTFDEYDRFAQANGRSLPSDQGWGRGRRPVINVSRDEAQAYAAWLTTQTGHPYRLPTEAEWEYAARAGTVTARYWGDNPDWGCEFANGGDLTGQRVFPGWTVMHCTDGEVYTAEVGRYRPNGFGLYDMLGNVVEWTCSVYETPYREEVQRCGKGGVAVARGGSWSDEPRSLRAADRQKMDLTTQANYLGFRVAREL